MNIFTLIQSAIKSMVANKVRTALTVLGMVIGIGSVIVVFSAGHGIERLIVGQIESFGTDIIQVEIKVPTNKSVTNLSHEGATDLVQGAQITSLTLEDMEDVIKLPNISDGYVGILGQEQVSYGNEKIKGLILGTSASYIDIDKSTLSEGRFFSREEDNSLSKVVVIGSEMKRKLFGDSEALGRQIKIRKTKFRVIGVMKERGAVMGMDFDNFAYLPVKSLQKRVMGINHVLYMVFELKDNDLADDTAWEIRRLLRDNHDIYVEDEKEFNRDDFRVVTMDEMMSIMGTVTDAITLLLLAIVAISLVVGGVGIMNIMYVIVNERSQEIGLRKAVGATYSNIMSQFLVEALIITLVGGLIGILFGVGVSFLLAIGATSFGLDWDFKIPLEAYIVSLGFSSFFGISFGLYPAKKAAQMEPITAMRQD